MKQQEHAELVPGRTSRCCRAGANWVDPPKRERKRANYNESEFYRQAMKSGGGGARASGVRLPKMPALQDFQFFAVPRLTEIFDKENAHELFKHAQAQKEAAARAQVRAILLQLPL